MQLIHLSLSNFRIFQRLEMEFPNRLTLLWGDNAQGKTSVLEAVHFLSILTSPLASNDREIISLLSLSDEMPVSRLVARFQKREKTHLIEARLILNSVSNGNHRLRKEVLIDGVKKRLFDAVGFFNSVLFLPQMMRILEDGPQDRRRYLDQLLSQAIPGYVRALSAYQQALVRRNALLKQLSEKGGDQEQLTFWEDMLSENGAMLISARQQSLRDFERFACQQFGQLSGGKEELRIEYLPSFSLSSQAEQPDRKPPMQEKFESDDMPEWIKGEFKRKLKLLRAEEIQRGLTTIGPHRDEIRFFSNGVDLGVYGSRGQIRTAVMALKIAEVCWLREKTGELPVLLLDETLAELDENRRSDLLAGLKGDQQAILTTTDLNLFTPAFRSDCQIWRVSQGVVGQFEP